jgi:putative transposase
VHRSSYRAWRKRPKGLSAEEQRLRSHVKAAHTLSNGSAGARTITTIVTAQGFPLSRYRATRRMRVLGLVSSQLPRHRYKKADQMHIAIPNRLDHQFDVEASTAVWTGDITYVCTGRRWGCLTIVLDLYARRPVG